LEDKVMDSALWSICADIGVIMSHFKAEGRSKGVNGRGYLGFKIFSEEFLGCRSRIKSSVE
jgi:hypothetical protein